MSSVVVTGASRGIGRYLCDSLSDTFDVVGVARTVSKDFPHRFIEADVTDVGQLKGGIRGLGLRQLYAVINCAGIASMNLFMTTPLETARRMLDVNAFGTMATCHTLLPALIRNGEGRVINFSTIAVSLGLEGEAVYVASKAAVEAFSRVLAKEIGGYGITVNTVAPNPVDTALLAGVDESKIARIVQQKQAINRKGTFDDVLNIVRFYLDERSSLVTGQVIGLGGS